MKNKITVSLTLICLLIANTIDAQILLPPYDYSKVNLDIANRANSPLIDIEDKVDETDNPSIEYLFQQGDRVPLRISGILSFNNGLDSIAKNKSVKVLFEFGLFKRVSYYFAFNTGTRLESNKNFTPNSLLHPEADNFSFFAGSGVKLYKTPRPFHQLTKVYDYGNGKKGVSRAEIVFQYGLQDRHFRRNDTTISADTSANSKSFKYDVSSYHLGIKWLHDFVSGDQNIGFIIYPYFSGINVHDNTIADYEVAFNRSIDHNKNPKGLPNWYVGGGIQASVHINKLIFAINYSYLVGKNRVADKSGDFDVPGVTGSQVFVKAAISIDTIDLSGFLRTD